MSSSPYSPEEVSSFIDNLLNAKDPATVGLRKILRRKSEQGLDFSIHSPVMEEFEESGKKCKVLNEDEQRILELEKEVINFQVQLKKQQENARNAVQRAFTQGKEAGLKEGYEGGRTETAVEYEKKIDDIQGEMETFLKNLDDSKREIFYNSEHILLRLCREIVKKIISSEVTTNQDVVLSVLKKAISYIGDRERLVVRIAPDDLETVTGRKDFWVPVTERLTNVVIEADERVGRGGCIIESNSGIADARLGVQFEELMNLVENVWQNINFSARQDDSVDMLEENENEMQEL